MKIVIVDDHPLARKGVISILSDNKNMSEIFEAANINEALTIIEKIKPEIVILDLKLGKEDGLEVANHGKALCNSAKFIILTSFMSQIDFIRAEKIGVEGYILKETIAEDIRYVVDLVLRGKKYYDPGIVNHFKNKLDSNRIDQLTNREKEVLFQVGKGLSNEGIANQLFISVNTVKKHISNILLKLELEHRTQVALLVKDIEE